MQRVLLLITFFLIAREAFCQETPFNIRDYGDRFMECYYTVKTFASIPMSDDGQQAIEQKIFNLTEELRGNWVNHKAVFNSRLTPADLKDLDQILTGFTNHSIDNLETGEQRMSLLLWLSLERSKMRSIYLNLQRQ